ncbi:type 11 methyltransferase [Longimycelium tulufanense]|uniref:Type 11 methyltransferase n=1 Tax=Longimycelium tulufanense TaxID=907463 RepID=A0A8J3CAK5_9PSEU|nr:type 11 methyltransferase [Longimycelium tulufanense]
MAGASGGTSEGSGGTSEEELRARRSLSFGSRAAEYAEHRPDYPGAAVDWALEPVRDRRPLRVLDLAAGTGKLTASLVGRADEVTAVEPHPQMRAELGRRVSGVVALDGTAERIPLPDGSVDAVLVAQAFHWFDAQPALREIARVLAPGGVLTAIWNLEDDRVEWVAALSRIQEIGPSYEKHHTRGLPVHESFAPSETRDFPHSHHRTIDSLVRTVGTYSLALIRDPEDRATLFERIRSYLRSRPETAGGEFDFPLVTHAVRMVRR